RALSTNPRRLGGCTHARRAVARHVNFLKTKALAGICRHRVMSVLPADMCSQLPMSALGQKQTFAAHKPMSALPPNSDRKSRHLPKLMSALLPKADMCSALAHVCFGPIADIALLF